MTKCKHEEQYLAYVEVQENTISWTIGDENETPHSNLEPGPITKASVQCACGRSWNVTPSAPEFVKLFFFKLQRKLEHKLYLCRYKMSEVLPKKKTSYEFMKSSNSSDWIDFPTTEGE